VRIGRPQQPLDVLEENLPGDVVPEKLLLKRHARPAREGRVLQVEHRLVQEGHHGENRQADLLSRIAAPPGFFIGCFESLPHLVAEQLGVRNRLPA
jgi:hypothetical protein